MIDFARFVARKESEAARANIPPMKTDLEAPLRRAIRIGNAWTRRMFDGDFFVAPPSEDLPSTSLVFVQSKDGNTASPHPAALGGGEADKHLIYEGLSRVAADAVLTGARTVGGGKIVKSVWHPELVRLRASLGRPRHPVQMIATLRRLPFEESLLFNVPDVRVFLITTAAPAAEMRDALASRPWITPVIMAAPSDLSFALRHIRGLGIERVSCVGGRTLAGQLLDAGVIDDVYLTTGATPGGEPNTPLYSKPLGGCLAVRKHGTGPEGGVRFEHIAFSR